MRGRKPKSNAIRRQTASAVDAVVLSPTSHDGLSKPSEVETSESRSALWDLVVGDGRAYTPQDVPTLSQLVMWMDVARTCRDALDDGDGGLLVMAVDANGGMHENPVVGTMKKATDEVLRLSDQLGCTPLARARIGITETATQSMQVDIAAKIRAAMRDGA